MPPEDFYDSYDEEFHQLVVFDEFRGQKKLCTLNRWLQGGDFTVARKGSQFVKTKNLPFIFLSNFSPQAAYPKMSLANDPSFSAFLARITVIEVTQPIDLDNIDFIEQEPVVQSEKSSVDEEDNQ